MLTKLSQAITITVCLYLIVNLKLLTTARTSSEATMLHPSLPNQVKRLPQWVKLIGTKP
ncbi:hypothetical protein [Thermocoleostomius sinensis]|jgi:hypothetical protein|uniref:Uncharacterized protein n=1 Tax=Thermocoleostomius sinensis A174 TaxID=2016057 RepID=A0A9E8ZID9_9CYAN|nr:hypothetical protein [Thermocoleostomius sinensis]WAL62262.1 hypothetical protein OXH18_09815 [Thermocoleostomius sinensis A174]